MSRAHTATAAAEAHAAEHNRDTRPEGAPLLYSTPEAAAYCRGATSNFNKMRMTGSGPKYLKLGKRVFYTKAALDAWLEARTFKSTSEYGTAA